MTIFQQGDFTLASGQKTGWRLECDELTEADWATLAELISYRFEFKAVTGVPRGGLPLAQALERYITPNSITDRHLIVDDVYTTGGSIRKVLNELIIQSERYCRYQGIVVFARERIRVEDKLWVQPLFQFWN